MIQHVKIENFRCLRNVDVPLRSLTVLLGENDTGKSTFLKAIENVLSVSGDKAGFVKADHWGGNDERNIRVLLRDSNQMVYRQWDSRKAAYVRDPPTEQVWSFAAYSLPSKGLPLRGRGYADSGIPPQIDENGSQIPALLDHYLRRSRKRFDEFVEAMKSRVPGLQDIEISTPTPEERSIDFVIENGLRIPPESVSFGVRALLFFLASAFHPQPPDLLLIEEPENGLHPHRLGDVLKLLREITAGTHTGRPAQVILTTHSPYLLDHIDLATDQVLVFRRCDDGSRTAEPADADRLKMFLDEFMLGEVWFNQHEAGLVKRT